MTHVETDFSSWDGIDRRGFDRWVGKFSMEANRKNFYSIFWKHSGSGEELPTPFLQIMLEVKNENLNTKNTEKRTGSSIPPNMVRLLNAILACGGTRMEQLERGQKIRNVFQKILYLQDRWKGTERWGFARDNNLQALFAGSTLFLWL